MIWPGLEHVLSQFLAHSEPALINRDIVHDRVGPGQVNVLKKARSQFRLRGANFSLNGAIHLDHDRLSRSNISQGAVSQDIQRHTFGSRHHRTPVAIDKLAQHQRANAIRIPKCH